MPIGVVDLADVRACRNCGVDYLRVLDTIGDDVIVQLEPMAVRGLDVVDPTGRRHTWGWRLVGRHWRVHHFDAEPDLYAFRDHVCVAGMSNERGHRMTADPFGTASPPGATGPGCEELEGKLVLLSVNNIERGIVTKFGAADAVRCDVVDLTSGESHGDTLLFGKVLVGQLVAGTKYVGRLGRGQAVPPNSPPWVWIDGDDNDKAVAVRYLTYAAGQQVATPAAPPPQAPAYAAPATPVAPPAPAAPAAPAAPTAPPWATG